MTSGVVSLLDVLRNCRGAQLLEGISDISGWGSMRDDSHTREERYGDRGKLPMLHSNVKGLGLKISAREIEKLNQHMSRAVADIQSRPKDKQKAELTESIENELRSRFDNLSSVIHSELEERIFYAIQSEKQGYCKPEWLSDTLIRVTSRMHLRNSSVQGDVLPTMNAPPPCFTL